ncbi:hypothetical protein CHS0354_019472 [Potamilus streckersoni]|uniref:G-protein coupled receptors family 1 profile domain-containing protein n=1 Tax=Potamilus streckersoni TaxID=2493646 RepID=A0AAE0VWF7_9BIVA|nr:hypothetical protein CHS0354_019472 [Potamilus streckersoni]
MKSSVIPADKIFDNMSTTSKNSFSLIEMETKIRAERTHIIPVDPYARQFLAGYVADDIVIFNISGFFCARQAVVIKTKVPFVKMTAIFADYNLTHYSMDYPDINLTLELSKFLEQIEEKPTISEITLKILFYVVSMCGAFFGNLTIILVIACHRVLRTKFNFYIINLVTADLLVPVFCMWVHLVSSLNKQWPLGETFCRIHTFVQGRGIHFDLRPVDQARCALLRVVKREQWIPVPR